MDQLIRKHGFKIIVGLLLLIVALWFVLVQFKEDTSFPYNEEAPDFELTHVDGSTVSLENTEGKVRLVYFYFSTCPDVCPPTTYFLSQVQDGLKENGSFGEDAAIMSITFDPERDTTERLKQFAGNYNADFDGWYFLRKDDPYYLQQLAYAYGIYVNEEEDGTFTHSNLITLVDGKGNIRKRYAVTEDLTAEQIVKDMESLM